MSSTTRQARLQDNQTGVELAHVMLIGQGIDSSNALPHGGSVRYFSLLSGNILYAWTKQLPLLLDQDGTHYQVRIAALPAASGEGGFLEFLG